MKTSWVAGLFAVYFLVMGLEMMMSGASGLSSTVSANAEALAGSGFADQSSSVSAFAAIVTGVSAFFVTFVQTVFLYSPTLFAGSMNWIWFYFCLPLSLATIFAVVSIARGVSAG